MRVEKWGDGLVVRLPGAVIKALALKEGDEVEIHVARAEVLSAAGELNPHQALARLRKYRGRMPAGFRFDRIEENKRR